ncbi:hypothetical protein ATN37_01105 [Rhodococcus sp. MH15]|nr:hypothetical protein [Rhodococcus sp. MH15]
MWSADKSRLLASARFVLTAVTSGRAREQHALAELTQLAVDGDLDHVLAAAADAAAFDCGANAVPITSVMSARRTCRAVGSRMCVAPLTFAVDLVSCS